MEIRRRLSSCSAFTSWLHSPHAFISFGPTYHGDKLALAYHLGSSEDSQGTEVTRGKMPLADATRLNGFA